jgi:hypothetical protein
MKGVPVDFIIFIADVIEVDDDRGSVPALIDF